MADSPLEHGLIGGVERRAIKIVEYSPTWPQDFARQRTIISGALGAVALRIEHIGSTAVPRLAAKPIIDILVVVRDSSEESAYLSRLASAGYDLRVREPDWNEHRMLRTPEQDVHVHVYSAGCPEIDRCLAFRDRLRTNAANRIEYEMTKRRLASRDWSDMNAYAAAKSEVIETILAGGVPGVSSPPTE